MRRIYVIVSIASLWAATYLALGNKYMTRTVDPYVIREKVQSHKQFYLILEDRHGQTFAYDTGPATFMMRATGSTVHLSLRPMDKRQTPRENLLYFFGPLILFCFTLVLTCTVLLYGLWKRWSKP